MVSLPLPMLLPIKTIPVSASDPPPRHMGGAYVSGRTPAPPPPSLCPPPPPTPICGNRERPIDLGANGAQITPAPFDDTQNAPI